MFSMLMEGTDCVCTPADTEQRSSWGCCSVTLVTYCGVNIIFTVGGCVCLFGACVYLTGCALFGRWCLLEEINSHLEAVVAVCCYLWNEITYKQGKHICST